jgi:beta-phosphoglucomutase
MSARCQGCGVIFDMDGVLVDTARAHYTSWQVVAQKWGVPISWEKFHASFGQPNHQIVPLILGRSVSPEELREVDRVKEEAFRAIIGTQVKPMPGVLRLIGQLHEQGFRLAVGSSGPRENISLILKALGVACRFGCIVSGWDVERGKPAPDVFLKAAEGIGVPPARCLVIEDVPAGIQAARAAGMKCVAVASTHSAQMLGEADRVVDSLDAVSADDVAALLGIG